MFLLRQLYIDNTNDNDNDNDDNNDDNDANDDDNGHMMNKSWLHRLIGMYAKLAKNLGFLISLQDKLFPIDTLCT